MTQQPTPPDAPAGAPQTIHPPAAPAKNTVGLIAIILAAVGFVFACIPGALIIGWVLLPVAFILGIVGVTRAGQRKGTSIAAIIVSVIGTIVGVVVFVAVAATAVSDAFDEAAGGDTTAIPAGEASATPTAGTDGEQDPGDDPAEQPEDAATAAGTRDNPFPFGDTVANDDWTVALTAFDADANDEIASADEFNDAPPAGYRWVTVDVAATYTGEDAGSVLGVSIDYVTADGTVVGAFDELVFGLEPEWDVLAELYNGGVEDGRLAFLVPDSVDGQFRVRPGLFADEVFLALPAS